MLPDRSAATLVAPSSGAAQFPVYLSSMLSLFLSLDVFLSPTISKSICLSRWRAHTARRRLSIPFNLACKCRLNIFRHPTKAPPPPTPSSALFPVTISLSGGIRVGRSRNFEAGGEHAGCISMYRRERETLERYHPLGFQSRRASEQANEILM